MFQSIQNFFRPQQSVTPETPSTGKTTSHEPISEAHFEECRRRKQVALSHGYVILPSGPYLAYPKSIGFLERPSEQLSSMPSSVHLPVTIIASDEAKVDGSWLAAELSRLQDDDDVFSDDFHSNIIFCRKSPSVANQSPQLDQTAVKLLEEIGTTHHGFVGFQSWLPGPYFIKDRILYEAWRLYPDFTEAFYFSTIPDPENPNYFLPLTISAFDHLRTVAVPSRHYFTQTKEKPLNGRRIAIKDIYDLNGARTAASNRAFRDLYSARNRTANVIQRLIDDGAIIVGKTKTTTFADRELATQDWIDTHSPFNPRGDGYIWGGGSSTGSASAIAAYDWLDFAIGSDTSGSARGPAANHGIYGFRPSFCSTAMDGVVPSSILFDTPAFFARDVESAEHFAKTWYQLQSVEDVLQAKSWEPRKILWPTEYCDRNSQYVVTHNEDVHIRFEHFVSELEAFLGVKRTVVSLRDLWNKRELYQPGRDFDEYFKYTYEAILNRDSYTNNLGFVEDYKRVVGWHLYLPPSIMNRWKHGKIITEEEREHAAEQISEFKQWFEKEVLGHDGDTHSLAVMVWPWTVGTPNYLDLPRPEPNLNYGYGFQPTYTCSFTGGPEFVFPIGTWTYDSKVSGQQEHLPVAASLLSAAGLDYELITFARRFLQKCDHLPDAVKTGRHMSGPDPTKGDQKLDPPTYGSHQPNSVRAASSRYCLKE